MSGLPDQDDIEEGKLYTPSDVQHIVARKVAAHQITTLEHGQIELQKKLVDMTAAFTAELKGLRELIEKVPVMMREQRHIITAEHEKEFATKAELMISNNATNQKIETLDRKMSDQIAVIDRKLGEQWLKITVAIGTITALGVFLNWTIAVGNGIGKLA